MPTSPSALALDPLNHDLFLDEQGQLAAYTTTTDRVTQAIKCRLQTVRGEWYQEPGIGVPFFEEVAVKGPNLTTLKSLFASVIAGTPGVRSVDSLTVSFSAATRTLLVKFAVTATDGTTVQGSI